MIEIPNKVDWRRLIMTLEYKKLKIKFIGSETGIPPTTISNYKNRAAEPPYCHGATIINFSMEYCTKPELDLCGVEL